MDDLCEEARAKTESKSKGEDNNKKVKAEDATALGEVMMNKKMPRLLSLRGPIGIGPKQSRALKLGIASSLAMLAVALPAYARAPAPAVNAAAVVIMDRNSKEILHAVNPDRLWPAASITKLAAAAVTLRHAALTKRVRMLAADEVGGARLRVRDGALLTVRDLLAATLIGSANNTANTLVRASGRSRKQFVAEMNAFARQAGAKKTRFTEPSGIDPNNITTARELALIARAAFSYSTIRSLTQQASYIVRVLNTGEKHLIKNTNKLITNSPLIILGGKTGLLDESDHNFVVEVRNKKWQRLMIVIFGAPSFQSAFQSAEKLAAWSWQ